MKKSIEKLDLDASKTFLLQTTVASLVYFQEICSERNITIHELTKEHIVNYLLKGLPPDK